MKAFVEIYEDGSIVKFMNDDDTIVDEYAVSEIRVKMRDGHIAARGAHETCVEKVEKH